ncbi:MAG: hypothetical protein ACE15C_06390 [Phycisphaerae bacterium]
MSVTVCPQCKGTVQRGPWEIVPKCPNCGADWPVEPGAPERMVRMIIRRAWLYGILSFVPVVGIAFGVLGLLWGFLAASRRRIATAVPVLLLSAIVGIVIQPFLAYWAYGYEIDRMCLADVTRLAEALQMYRSSSHDLPPSIAVLAEVEGPVPKRCRAGGGIYLYFHPSTATQPAIRPPTAGQTTLPATGPATAPATLPTTTQSVPALAESAPTSLSPAGQPASTQPATKPAQSPDLQLLVAELKPEHRQVRMCITADLRVRAIPHAEFRRMLAQPYNHQFAAAMAPPPAKQTTTNLQVENPNLRILGMSPKQLVWASTAAITAFCALGIWLLIRAARRERRQEAQQHANDSMSTDFTDKRNSEDSV